MQNEDCLEDNENTDVHNNTEAQQHKKAHAYFNKNVLRNSFGHSCLVRDRLWFKYDLKVVSIVHEDILRKIIMVI